MPLRSNSKQPYVEGWPELQARPTTVEDTDMLARDVCPEANVGVLLCGTSGIDVLDLDKKNMITGRTPPEFFELLGNPMKLGVPFNFTGGGGVQFFFKHDLRLDKNLGGKKALHLGVEWYGSTKVAHNFVFPPSVHPTGPLYREGTPLYPDRLTQTLFDVLPSVAADIQATAEPRALGAPEKSSAVAQYVIEALRPHWPEEGQRHSFALAFGGWAATHHVPRGAAVETIRRVGANADDDELVDRTRAVCDSYARFDAGEPVAFKEALGPQLLEDLDRALARAGLLDFPQPVDVHDLPAPVFPLFELFDTPGLLTAGRTVAVIAGEPGSRKSWLAWEIVKATATGAALHPLRKNPSPPMPVLFLSLDTYGGTLYERVRGDVGDIPRGMIDVIHRLMRPRIDLMKVVVASRLAELVGEKRHGLVVIDTIRWAHTGNELDQKQMHELVAACDLIVEAGAGVLVVAHTPKRGSRASDEPTLDWVRGASSFAGAIHTAAIVENVGDGRSTVTWVKANDCADFPAPFAFSILDSRYHFDIKDQVYAKAALVDVLPTFIERINNDPTICPPAEEAKAKATIELLIEQAKTVRGLPYGRGKVEEALDVLVQRKRVERAKVGARHKWVYWVAK